MLWMNPAYRLCLGSDPGQAYEAIAQLTAENDFHAKQNRTTGRCFLPTEDGPLAVYLKRHYTPIDPRSPGTAPGPLEWANLRRAEELGIPVAEPIVMGENPGHRCTSFIALRSLEGYEPLHRFIPEQLIGAVDEAILRRYLVRRLAEITRRLHDAHLFHRDLYLCHFFVRRTGDERVPLDVVLIDWGRLLSSSRPRWRVKDLAQLRFSSELPGVTSGDRLRFLAYYERGRPRTWRSKWLWLEVAVKARIYAWNERRSRRTAA